MNRRLTRVLKISILRLHPSRGHVMHPMFRRRLRPIAAVVLVFFSWFSIEPWNYALAAQDSSALGTSRTSVSQPKAPTAPEVFETNLRSIKEQVGAARDGDAYQAQLSGLLKSLEQAVTQSSRELESTRQAVDRLARAIEHGTPSQDAIKAVQSQQQAVKAAVGQVRLNASGIEGLLRGMALPAGLSKDQKQAKEAVNSLLKAFDATLTAMTQRAEQRRGFDVTEHQVFLAASMELDKGLATLQMRAQALTKEATPERRRAQLWADAFSKRDSLLSADKAIRKEFDQTEAFLKEKSLPQEILDRHYAAVSDYERNFSQLKASFTEVDNAHRAYASATERGNETAAQTAERDLESKLSAFDDFLKANVKDSPHQQLDPNNLPHRTPKPTERKPRLKKEEFAEFQPQIRLAYNGDPANLMLAQANPDIPTPADLAETIEVQFTPEIQALAAELEHNPVKIYNWVRNNIDFVPTYGSIQGAQGCLTTKQCNDMDTASLLIALLRTSGIAARYVIGTIEVPIEQLNNWVGGFTDELAALDFIASAGTPVSMGSISGGNVSTAFLEHVWTETYVDFIPSRGTRHQQGDSWVPLDGSFKHYAYKPNMDLSNAFMLDAQAFTNQLTAGATINETESSATHLDAEAMQTTLRTLRNQLATHVTQVMPNATVGDVIGAKRFIAQNLPRLSGVLPYRVVSLGAKVSALPTTARHEITIDIPGGPLSVEPSLRYAGALSTLAGQRLTFSYVPATPADQAVISSLLPAPHPDGSPLQPEELPSAFPAYLIHLIPELRVNGQVVITGGPVRMGEGQTLTIRFEDPSGLGSAPVAHVITAGEYASILLNAGGVSASPLTAQQGRLQALKTKIEANDWTGVTKDGLIGELLASVITTYFYEVDVADQLRAQAMGLVHVRLPSEGGFFLSLKTTYVFGVPKSVGPSGMTLDVPKIFYTVRAKNGDAREITKFGILSGPFASALEHSVPEQLLSSSTVPVEAVSAVKALALANSQGIPIYTITPQNSASVLPQLAIPVSSLTDIKNAVNAGKIVAVSKTPVLFHGRAVLGYMVLDPETGAGAYIISGNNGGLADVGINVLLGLVWGTFFFAALFAGLISGGFLLPIFLGVVGGLGLAALKWIARPDDPFTAKGVITSIVGPSGGLVLSMILDVFVGLAPLGLITPFSPALLALFSIVALITIVLISVDYLYTFASLQYRRRYV
ncbi:MAG: transglutaminase domain-containing protein [Nitrospirota bacterium]